MAPKETNNMKSKIRCAIVTGASGGIGTAVTKRLAEDGFAVVVHYSGNSDAADKLAAGIQKSGGKAVAVQADITKPDQVESLFKKALAEFGKIDAVVHTAGIMTLKPIEAGDIESFDRVIAINLRGTYLVLSQAAKHVAEGGRVVAFSSSVVGVSFPNYGAYIASKAGVEGLVHVLANELRGKNITVNAVAPGPTATKLFLNGKSEHQIEQMKKLSPLERLGQPDDIARAVSFLVGLDGGWVNSQVMRINGGFV
jgi:3-oxoacyl-[acyl-carrier protein] reductase